MFIIVNKIALKSEVNKKNYCCIEMAESATVIRINNT